MLQKSTNKLYILNTKNHRVNHTAFFSLKIKCFDSLNQQFQLEIQEESVIFHA